MWWYIHEHNGYSMNTWGELVSNNNKWRSLRWVKLCCPLAGLMRPCAVHMFQQRLLPPSRIIYGSISQQCLRTSWKLPRSFPRSFPIILLLGKRWRDLNPMLPIKRRAMSAAARSQWYSCRKKTTKKPTVELFCTKILIDTNLCGRNIECLMWVAQLFSRYHVQFN